MGDESLDASLARSEALLTGIRGAPGRAELEKLFFDAIGDGDKGAVLWPLRVALTGRKASPGPFEVMDILGIPESLGRVQKARQQLL